MYSQATGNKGATFGLLLIVFLSIMICVLGTFLTVSSSPSLINPYYHPLTSSGRSNLVGPSPRQRDTLLGLFLSSQRKAQLSRPRHSPRCGPMYGFWRHPARQQNCVYRPSGLLHHPHHRVVRSRHWATFVYWQEERSQRTILDGFSRLCRQRYCCAPDYILQHHVLLP